MKFYRLNENREPELTDTPDWSGNKLFQTLMGNYFISTIFLSIDHNFTGGGNPVLFETMVFHQSTGFMEQYAERYTTYDDAVIGHQRAVNVVHEAVRQNRDDLYAIMEELEDCIKEGK